MVSYTLGLDRLHFAMSTQDRLNPKRKGSKKISFSSNVAKQPSGSNSKVTRPSVFLKKRRESPASHYPEMVAPDLNQDESERPITPIVEELTRIKERVTMVRQCSFICNEVTEPKIS